MWIERKFISLMGSHVRNFKKVRQDLYQLSCPICGDSARDKRKARGYIYLMDREFRFKCHNCGDGRKFSNLLYFVAPNLYKEYKFEKFKDSNPEAEEIEEKDVAVRHSNLYELDDVASRISRLSNNHPAYLYLKNRLIPFRWFEKLYYVDDISVLKSLFPKYEDQKFLPEGRIVIPIYNRTRRLIGVTCRALGPSKLRYIMLHENDEEPLIFNLDSVDFNKRIYAFEGAFDSMFATNSVAVDGADFNKLFELIPKEQVVVVFDNQPRNRSLIQRIEGISNQNVKMFMWPENINQGKDVNEWIKSGGNPDELMKIIDNNVYCGMSLKLKLAQWKKIGTIQSKNY